MLSSVLADICRSAFWASPWITLWANGKRWKSFCKNGRVEIDNNLVKNAIRPTALGKKNWLFMGDADVGERGAIIYMIIENRRRRGIDPYACRKDVLTRLPRMTNHQIHKVTPAAWDKAHLRPQLCYDTYDFSIRTISRGSRRNAYCRKSSRALQAVRKPSFLINPVTQAPPF